MIAARRKRRDAWRINDQVLPADASEFQMRAERRLGLVIAEAKKGGHFVEHRPLRTSVRRSSRHLAACSGHRHGKG